MSTSELASKDRIIQQQSDEMEALKQRMSAVSQKNEELVAERRNVTELIQAEEAKERKALESDAKKLIHDVNRMRHARDTLQQSLELANISNSVESKKSEEILALSNARKDRITSLENDLGRLKMKYAAEVPEFALLEFFTSDPDGNPYAVISQELKYLTFN
jgi:chromosome segregation ATPase